MEQTKQTAGNRNRAIRKIWRGFQMMGRPILRHGVFILFMTLLAVITYSIVGEPHTKHPLFYVGQFMMDLYVLCALFCVLPNRAMYVLKYSLYALSYALCFVEAFVFRRFFLAFSPTMLHLILETNDGEASEFIDSVLQSPLFTTTLLEYALLLTANVVIGRWGYVWYTALAGRLRRGKPRGKLWGRAAGRAMQGIVFPVAALILLVSNGAAWSREKWKMVDFLLIDSTTEAEKISGNVFYSPPYRVLYSFKFALVVRHDTSQLIERMQHLGHGTAEMTEPIDGSAPEDIVVIIGESYNKHHAQCYGYGAETTPRLAEMQKQGELTVFTDAVTPWNITANAFKNMLSTHSADSPGTWTDGVLFPALFHQAGWGTAFISNQFYRSKRQNRSDFNSSFFLHDPRIDSLCFDYRNTRHYRYDEGLWKEMQHVDRRKHNLYIFHLMGQHVMYSERYPQRHSYFSADDVFRPELGMKERSIVAAYDNATRYNDSVVSVLIGKFRHRDAVVIYLADHGDEVYDGNLRMFGRNHSAMLTPEILRNEFEVPLVIWTSPRFKAKHRETVGSIVSAAGSAFATDDLPHLVLGLSCIRTSYYKPERDILSPLYRPRKRPIKGIAIYEDIMGTVEL